MKHGLRRSGGRAKAIYAYSVNIIDTCRLYRTGQKEKSQRNLSLTFTPIYSIATHHCLSPRVMTAVVRFETINICCGGWLAQDEAHRKYMSSLPIRTLKASRIGGSGPDVRTSGGHAPSLLS